MFLKMLIFIVLTCLNLASGHFHHHQPIFSRFYKPKLVPFQTNTAQEFSRTVIESHKIYPCVFKQETFVDGDEFCGVKNLKIQRHADFWCIGYLPSGAERLSMTLDRAFRFVSYPQVNYRQQKTFHLEFLFDKKGAFAIKIVSTGEGLTSLNDLRVNDVPVCQSPKPETTTCGSRKVRHVKLIANAITTRVGDWPWHVALFHIQQTSLSYKCGGALISATFVLTCAHCVTEQGQTLIPERIQLHLGKQKLYQSDENSKEVGVHKILPHAKFDVEAGQFDVALLKLTQEIHFTPYIQPACLPDSSSDTFGTVIGFGRTETGYISDVLRQAEMNIIPKIDCLEANRDFYGQLLYHGNFCAGQNGSGTPCMGDSGGGFFVQRCGRWMVRGLVSIGVRAVAENGCDPESYVLFTDVYQHMKWITDNMQL